MISNIGKNNTRIEAFDMTHDQNPLIPRDSLRVFNRKEHYGTSPSDSYPKYCIVHLDFLTKSHEKFDFTFSFLIKIASMFEVHLSRSAPSYWTPPGLSPNHRKETKLQCSFKILKPAKAWKCSHSLAAPIETGMLDFWFDPNRARISRYYRANRARISH